MLGLSLRQKYKSVRWWLQSYSANLSLDWLIIVMPSAFVHHKYCIGTQIDHKCNFLLISALKEELQGSQQLPRILSSWQLLGNPSQIRQRPCLGWWRRKRTLIWYSNVLAVTSSRMKRACPTVTTPVLTVGPPCTGTDNQIQSLQSYTLTCILYYICTVHNTPRTMYFVLYMYTIHNQKYIHMKV